MANAKRVRKNLRLTAHRTQQPQTTTQYELDLLEIFFHYPAPSYPANEQQNQPATKTANRSFLTLCGWFG